MSELNLVLVGPPGPGRGPRQSGWSRTSAALLLDGIILRAADRGGSELGKEAKKYMDDGELVPDELICNVIAERLDSGEADDGFLLDGFPRTIGQAEMLDRSSRAAGGAHLRAPDRRAGRRGDPPALGAPDLREERPRLPRGVRPPKNEGVCDQDGSRLSSATTTRPRPIRERLSVYHEQTEPLIKWYEDSGLLRRFDGTRRPTRCTTASVPRWLRSDSEAEL